METQAVVQKIVAQIPGADVRIEGEDCSFTLAVISDGFSGLSPLKRQQKVLAIFSEELSTGVLHALSVKTYTCDEWLLSQQNSLVNLS